MTPLLKIKFYMDLTVKIGEKIKDLVMFLRFLAAARISRVNCDELDGDRLRKPANRNSYRLLRVS